jgi:hypothetical protein
LTQRRVSQVIGQTFTLDAQAPQTFVRLGYPDDQYDDNGYNDHDDGNDNQCSFDNGNDGGPAHLTITIRTPAPIPDPVRPRPEGSVPPTVQPWDLIANLEAHQRAQFDDNLLFFNPRWQWQVPTANMPEFDLDQSSQSVSFDLVSGYKTAICGIGVISDGGRAVGHANWFDATIQGNIFWDHHDGGVSGDDDYNVKIVTPAIVDAVTGAPLTDDPLALVAASNSDIEGFRGTPLVKGEFDSDETVDQDEFNAIPWWRDFHTAVDDSDEAARAKINGHLAIMTGLAGLDLVHGTASEIHPVHVLAIRQTAAASAGNDAWSIFVRNFGDEGYCSEDQHYLDSATVTLRLPRPDGVDPRAQVTGLLAATQFIGHNISEVGPEVFSAPNQDTLVTFHLNSGGFFHDEDHLAFVVGELHMAWPTLGTPAPSSPLNASTAVPPTPSTAEEEEESEPEDLLSNAVAQLSPAQFQEFTARATAATPHLPAGTTVPLQAQLVTQPPPVTTAAPSVATGPATHLVQRDLARLTALCQLTSGQPVNLPDACQTIGPTTGITATPAIGDASCFLTPSVISLTAADASGTGIARIEYSVDGRGFVPFTGQFLAAQGATIAYRARDRAGNLEPTQTFTVPGDAAGDASRGAAVFGGHAVTIDDGAIFSSAGPSGAADLVNAGLGQTNIGSTANVLNVISRGQVTLRDRARVTGSIRSSQASVTRQNNTVVTGAITTRAALTLPDLSACTATFPPLGGSVFIAPDHIQSLVAGAYGDVSVQSRSSLKLTAGTYFMASLTLEPQSKVVLDASAGPIFLVVKNSLTIRGLFVDGNGKATDASLFYFGTQRVNVEVPFQGSIVAPAAFLSLASAGSTFSGSFFAKDVEVAPRITVKH